MSYNEAKKRRIKLISDQYDHIPTQSQIVKMVCGTFEEKADLTGRDIIWLTSACPKCPAGCTIRLQKGKGWTNAHNRLITCFGGKNGGKEALADAYWVKYDQEQRGEHGRDIREAIEFAAGYTAEEQAAMDWIKMITMSNWTLTSVENEDHRSIVKHNAIFSYKRICMLIFLLGEVVQEKLTKSMKDRHGILVYDGLSRDSTHYVGVYAAYIEDEEGKDEKLRIALLGVSPMSVIDDEEDDEAAAPVVTQDEEDDDEEMGNEQDPHYAAKFNAKTHVNHFASILDDYEQTIDSFAVAFLSDNTEVCRRTAKDCNVAHMPCLNHCHALDIS